MSFNVHVADEASPNAGDFIGSTQVSDTVSHFCVIPVGTKVEDIEAFIIDDFETTLSPLGDPDTFDAKKAIAQAERSLKIIKALKELDKQQKSA